MRTSALLFASTLAVLALHTRAAQAQECESDADCSAGQMCLYAPCAEPCAPGDECQPVDCAGRCVENEDPFTQECETDDDCDSDWVCQVVGGSGCADVACPDGAECPDPEPCEPEELRACVPPPPEPCTADADCEDGLVCVTYEYAACPPRDCPPDAEECMPEYGECDVVSESYCVPPYFAPCDEDEDCGDGFACVQGEMCGCSGGGAVDPGAPGEGGGEGGEGGDREEPECFCEPTGELYCELEEMPCSAESDCPEGFICEQLPQPTVPCSYDEETGETFCDDPTTGEEVGGQCVPETWMGWYGGAPAGSADDYDAAVGGALGGEAQAEGRAEELPPVTPLPDDGGGSDGESGGCQVANSGSGLALPLLAILGLVLVVARRRWI